MPDHKFHHYRWLQHNLRTLSEPRNPVQGRNMPTLLCSVRLCPQPGRKPFVFGFVRPLLNCSTLLRNTTPDLGLLGWYGGRPPAWNLRLGCSRSPTLFPIWRQLVQVVKFPTEIKWRKSSELTIPSAISSGSPLPLLSCAFPSISVSLVLS